MKRRTNLKDYGIVKLVITASPTNAKCSCTCPDPAAYIFKQFFCIMEFKAVLFRILRETKSDLSFKKVADALQFYILPTRMKSIKQGPSVDSCRSGTEELMGCCFKYFCCNTFEDFLYSYYPSALNHFQKMVCKKLQQLKPLKEKHYSREIPRTTY